MTIWTVHLRAGAAPVLVPERFSVMAALLGPVWLLWHRAWIAAVLLGCAEALALLLAPVALSGPFGLALAGLAGLHGHDLRRWGLARRGFAETRVVAARDVEAAWLRLLDQGPPALPEQPA